MTQTPTRDKPLFTPGPLTTSRSVKEAMLTDLGSRDAAFIAAVARVRAGLLDVAGVDPESWACVPMQGSGTFSVEAVVSCAVPRGASIVVCVNGAYGRRIVQIAERHGIGVVRVESAEHEPISPAAVGAALEANPGACMVAAIHCETTTGLMNPVEAIGRVARGAGRAFFVDSMSAFGAVELDLDRAGVDWLVSSSNKCIEGVPGFAFVLCRRSALEATRGQSRTVCLDLYEQWRGLEADGQFRFTPPTHVLLAFDRALAELRAEGGPAARGARYGERQRRIAQRMAALGFEPYLDGSLQGPIITSFRYPDTPGFDFGMFYRRLNEAGFVIYPGKVSDAACFRIGSIGRLRDEDIDGLLSAVGRIASEMGVSPVSV